MSRLSNPGTLVPAGKYYLGDPCYSVTDADWDHLRSTSDFFEMPVGTLLDGTKVYAMGTAWGDGVFRGSDGFDYSVDSGSIGLVPITVTLNANSMPQLVKIVEFTRPVMMSADNDVLYFGHICIDTGTYPVYDYDEEE
jgi:hypothetical protein